ncbi:endonuclease III [Pseudonocardia sp. RS11V-5]|uniref:endonuclease III domain-containing protein n=1 Tax=Pseudonocardia terrae TaxID=2905831 RepID=UPI001E39E764|nr:endonuclease III [Pseudonocardia terrae]MCE3555801.1 endonuclease III [Pseudonocardia terrae]
MSETYPVFADSDDEWMTSGMSDTPFRSLVSVALSTMTTSARTIKAGRALYARVSTFEELVALDDEDLREMIRSVAHYNHKTGRLKRMARQILDDHGGEVPRNREELLALPGIGRKCTDIIMNFLAEEPSIAVDTHVKRTVQRVGLVERGLSAEQTADVLQHITPTGYKAHAHEWLIQHGTKVCTARSPRCVGCPVVELCDHADAHPALRDAG